MMEEYVMEKDEQSNPCCVNWKEKYAKLKDKYSKLEEGRNALRKGLSILESQVAKTRAENAFLKKDFEDERIRENSDKDDGVKESEIRVALENEVSGLKSEILYLQQNGETEMKRLKEVLGKERKRGDVEEKKAEAERKKADEAAKNFKTENSRANEEKRLADIKRRRTKEIILELEALKCKFDETSELALVTAKFEEANEKLNAEREKTTMEGKHADIEMAKVEEQRKAAKANWKMAMDGKRREDNLSRQLEGNNKRVGELEKEIHEISKKKSVGLPVDQPVRHPSASEICSEIMRRGMNAEEECKRLEKVEQKLIKEKKWAKLDKKKAEEQRQVAEAYKKVAMEEKHHSDQLSQELGCYKQRLKEVKEEMQHLISSRLKVESLNLVSCRRLEAETAKIKLLRKKLKFEKLQVKHAKEVAKMERGHSQILRKQVLKLKPDLAQFLQRVDTLGDYVLLRHGSTNELERLGNSSSEQECFDAEPSQRNLSYGIVATEPSRTCTAAGEVDMRSNVVIQTKATTKSMQ